MWNDETKTKVETPEMRTRMVAARRQETIVLHGVSSPKQAKQGVLKEQSSSEAGHGRGLDAVGWRVHHRRLSILLATPLQPTDINLRRAGYSPERGINLHTSPPPALRNRIVAHFLLHLNLLLLRLLPVVARRLGREAQQLVLQRVEV